jgi:hypothetical protein
MLLVAGIYLGRTGNFIIRFSHHLQIDKNIG